MGILGFLTRKAKGDSPIHGDTVMNQSSVFITSKQVSPTNVSFNTVDKATIIPEHPTYLTQEQADLLDALALKKKLMVEETKRGYTALEKAIEHDTTVHKIHRHAQAVSAENELERQKENGKLAGTLHDQRVDYAQLSHDYQRRERVVSHTLAAKREAYSVRR